MDLREFVRTLRKGWPPIIASVLLGSVIGIGLTLATTKVYQSTVQIFVATSTNDSTSQLAGGNTFVQDRVQSYVSIANSPNVTGFVVDKLKLKGSPEQLAAKISSDAPQNKVLINLHVKDHDPRQAAILANAVAARFAVVVQTTEQTDSSGKPVVKLTVIHPATVSSSPIEPNKIVNIGVGFLIGLLVGIGLVVLRDALNNTLGSPKDFADLNIPVLGLVPFDKRTPKTPVAFRGDAHSARSEAYRQLRTNMQFVDVDNPPRVIAITSPLPGDGKSTTAINLAAALAESGARVCLIDADFRRPSIAAQLGLVGDVGFTSVLIGETPIEAVLQNAGRNFAVITSGPVPPNPSELLISEHARNVIAEVATRVDFTIIDTAPLLPVSDGAEVAIIADATLIVCRAAKTTHEQLARSMDALAKVGEKAVGVVLNMLSQTGRNSDYGYGYYYEPYRRRGEPHHSSAVNHVANDNADVVRRASSKVLS